MIPLKSPKYKYVRDVIESGDMMVLKRPGLISWATFSPASHVGMFVWRESDQNVLSVAESRELLGSRVVTFSSQVRQFPGMIDIYRPKDCPMEVKERAATLAFSWAGYGYNYPGIAALALDRLPILRFGAELLGYTRDRSSMVISPREKSKFCSQFYIWCYRKAKIEMGLIGGWEPCPGVNDGSVTPGHLMHSGAFELVASDIQP